MNIKTLRAAISSGKELKSNRVYVRISDTGRDTNGNKIAHYLARVYVAGESWIELATSGRRRRQVGFQTGRHEAAETALEKLGYSLAFQGINANGDAVYVVTNLET